MFEYTGAVNEMIHLDGSDDDETVNFIKHLILHKIQLNIYTMIDSSIDLEMASSIENSICTLRTLGCISPDCIPDHIINLLQYNASHFEYIYSDMQYIKTDIIAQELIMDNTNDKLYKCVPIPIIINKSIDVVKYLKSNKCEELIVNLFKHYEDLKFINDKKNTDIYLNNDYRKLKNSLLEYLERCVF